MDEDEPRNTDTEKIVLRSVGVDIGSTTLHLTFSRIELRRLGKALSSRFAPVHAEVIHRSKVVLTPYSEPETIDSRKLQDFVRGAYMEAWLTEEDVDTGVVVITGVAAEKANAKAVIDAVSSEGGKFVCAAAGPNLEAVMAAHGSGAVQESLMGLTVMNVDVGGATTKIAIAKDGAVIDTAAINVGARLMHLDEAGRIVRLEKAAEFLSDETAIHLTLGERPTDDAKKAFVEHLSRALMLLISRVQLPGFVKKLMMTEPISYKGTIDRLFFSGGVSEYIYGYEEREYGDLGKPLGQEIRRSVQNSAALRTLIREPLERIRATVIGAAQYTVQVSGSTIFVTHQKILPLRNIPVIAKISNAIDSPETQILQAFKMRDIESYDRIVALAISWLQPPSYPALRTLAEAIANVLGKLGGANLPLVLIFDQDVARLFGHILAHDLAVGSPLVCIDGIETTSLDYVDIGGILGNAKAVPVVVKTLVFGSQRPVSGQQSLI